MNGTQHTKHPVNRLMRWPLLCGLLFLALARSVSGQQTFGPEALYDNENNYAPVIPPNIDATNFLNNSTFTIVFLTSSHLLLFGTYDTLNYTNNGLMIGNNGFQFDTATSTNGIVTHSMASTFNNAGTIRAGSAIDGLVPVDAQPPELIVSATNIVNSGTVVVGQTAVITAETGTLTTTEEANGLLQFTGQNIDLTRSMLTVEGQGALSGFNAGVTATGGFGTDTNKDWIPSEDLTPTTAFSSEASPLAAIFPPNLAQLVLTNSTPFFVQQVVDTNNIITKMVFVENYNPITYNVYINGGNGGIGTGEATIEWIGSYLDSATGNTLNNYLYLNDDYVQGSVTNVGINTDGVPANFTFFQSPVQVAIGGLQASAYPTGLIQPLGAIVTNTYSYANAQFIATSVSTNSVATGALTNMPGRIQINASKELNLSLASISGLNYMSITSSNQFDGSTGAQISSPYSDINIGVTNGFLNVSNLTESFIPLWNGTVQCWSGRWFALATNFSISVDTNNVSTTNFFTVTNDYRVLIVGSQIKPTTASQSQDLILHGTNSIVISDTFNIMRRFFIDAQNLTLTTNTVGTGAQSLDGELNLLSGSLFWQNSVPNLRNLTNNGAIRLQNLALFGSPQTNYYNFITTGTITDQGSQIWANNFSGSGVFSNGVGSFALQSTNTVLTNLLLTAGANNISITTGSLLASNVVLQAGRSLALTATNLLTDTGVNSGNFWTVGAVALSGQPVLSLPVKPLAGDLLGTTITNIAPTGKNVFVTWAGNDYGASPAGFTNNEAVGRLILDGQQLPPNSLFTFNGTGVSNAIYVDYLEFRDGATNETSYNMNALSINTNITIYFAQAMLNGVSVAEKIDIASRFGNGVSNYNGGRLRWVPSYAGHFSSTNLVSGGVTNTVNAALAASPDIDSDGDGMGNASDLTPFFLTSQLNFMETMTNVPPPFGSIVLSWQTIPNATNYLYYKTNLMSTNWFLLLQTNSPQPYPSPATNITVLDPINPAMPRYYQVIVQPWLTYPY